MTPPGHGLLGVPDAGAFLARLTRLDPAAVVRLRPAPDAGEPRTVLWGRLPWSVLVTRTVRGGAPGDATVGASELLSVLTSGGAGLPLRRDAEWRWPLPPGAGRLVETVAAAELARIAEAAAGTLRTATAAAGRRVGERMLRDALLDHVAIVATPATAAGTPAAAPVEVPQRLVQAVVRMGFLGPAADLGGETAQIRLAGRWVALCGPFGTAWLPPINRFVIRPV
ncbi:MAG TPA: hypothetical protein VES42_21385 [Pilimelia sp.]|nr:hypothetical protein [Pilimelia sp.]